jgi:hypothetical protein
MVRLAACISVVICIINTLSVMKLCDIYWVGNSITITDLRLWLCTNNLSSCITLRGVVVLEMTSIHIYQIITLSRHPIHISTTKSILVLSIDCILVLLQLLLMCLILGV